MQDLVVMEITASRTIAKGLRLFVADPHSRNTFSVHNIVFFTPILGVYSPEPTKARISMRIEHERDGCEERNISWVQRGEKDIVRRSVHPKNRLSVSVNAKGTYSNLCRRQEASATARSLFDSALTEKHCPFVLANRTKNRWQTTNKAFIKNNSYE